MHMFYRMTALSVGPYPFVCPSVLHDNSRYEYCILYNEWSQIVPVVWVAYLFSALLL